MLIISVMLFICYYSEFSDAFNNQIMQFVSIARTLILDVQKPPLAVLMSGRGTSKC
jgi:hypothetical protein